MKPCLVTATLICLALLMATCQPAAEQPDPAAQAAKQAEDVAAIKSLGQEFGAAYKSGDASSAAALYTDDAILMPPNGPEVVSKEAIQSWYQTVFDQFTTEMALSVHEVKVAGDWAFDRGSYTFTRTPKAGGEPMQDNGKYVVIDKKQPDRSWKIYLDIWNSDRPLPGASE
jgi:uncharacterized protein (TIGR02246 family)